MIRGVCEHCQKDFRKREQRRRFCSLECSSRFNKNGLKLVTLPEYNSNLAELIGICLGDGCAWGYQTSITLGTVNDRTFIPYVVNLIKKIFPEVYISLIQRKDEKALDIRINSKIATDFLKSMGVVSHNKQVPGWITQNSDFVKACIKGLIDTDGTFIIHKYAVKGKIYRYLKISFTNRSENLLNFLDQGLRKSGIKSYRSFKYQVWIHDQKEVEKYVDIVGTGNWKENIIEFRRLNRLYSLSAKD